jgi:hypothetical protein
MRKQAISTIAAGIAIVALALPAAAKGPMVVEATLSGPGLDEPLSFRDKPQPPGGGGGEAEQFRLLADQSGVYDAIYSEGGVTAREPKGDLGPRHTVRWTMAFVAGEDGAIDPLGTIRMHLYPYADGGPVSFVPEQTYAGLEGEGMTVRPGWQHASPVLVENLQAWGLPTLRALTPPPAPGREPASDPTRSPATGSQIPWLLLVVVAAGLGAAGVLNAALRRTTART